MLTGFRQLLFCEQVALKYHNPILLKAMPGTIRNKYAETRIIWNSSGVGVRQKVFNKSAQIVWIQMNNLFLKMFIPSCFTIKHS